jgi:Predicted GTPase
LKQVINNARCDVVVSATPTDLNRIIKVNKPIVHVSYELSPIGKNLDTMIKNFIKSCE